MNKYLYLAEGVLFFVCWRVGMGNFSYWLVVGWLFASVLYIWTIWERAGISAKKVLGVILLALVPVVVRISLFDYTRIHVDDVIAGWISATTSFTRINFFAGLPLHKPDWMGQFPVFFFLFQKWFFFLSGQTLAALKWSVMPYVFLTGAGLYLLGEKLGDKRLGFLAVVWYAFFWPALYLETMGFMFVASTMMLVWWLYALARFDFQPNWKKAGMLGLLTGICLWFYISSYIAVPMLGLWFGIKLLLGKNRKLHLQQAVMAGLGFIITAGPLLAYAAGVDNYFLTRMNQVDLWSGSWSPYKALPQGQKWQLLEANFLLAIRSMYIDGLGGHGGYNFGRLGMLSGWNLGLLGFGLMVIVVLWRRQRFWGWIMLAVGASFMSMVLSIPPPAFHRFSAAFPLLGLIAAAPSLLWPEKWKRTGLVLVMVMGVFWGRENWNKFHQATEPENQNQDVLLINQILRDYPGRKVYIAAFPSYHLEKVWYFMAESYRDQKVTSKYHTDLIGKMNRDEKYVYIILWPHIYEYLFTSADIGGKRVPFNASYSLFVN